MPECFDLTKVIYTVFCLNGRLWNLSKIPRFRRKYFIPGTGSQKGKYFILVWMLPAPPLTQDPLLWKSVCATDTKEQGDPHPSTLLPDALQPLLQRARAREGRSSTVVVFEKITGSRRREKKEGVSAVPSTSSTPGTGGALWSTCTPPTESGSSGTSSPATREASNSSSGMLDRKKLTGSIEKQRKLVRKQRVSSRKMSGSMKKEGSEEEPRVNTLEPS